MSRTVRYASLVAVFALAVPVAAGGAGELRAESSDSAPVIPGGGAFGPEQPSEASPVIPGGGAFGPEHPAAPSSHQRTESSYDRIRRSFRKRMLKQLRREAGAP